MTLRVCCLIIASGFTAVLLGQPVYGASAPQSGLWEVSTKRERVGVTTPQATRTRCITEKQASELGTQPSVITSAGPAGPNCKFADWQKTPDGVTWRLQCPGPLAAEQTGRYVFDTAQHFTATFNTSVSIPGRERTSVLTIEARRIGECPK